MANQSKTIIEEIQGTVDQIIAQVKRLVKEGNARRVIIKNKHGKTLFQSQLTIGAAGATFFMIYAPILSAITTLVLMANDVTVLVEREIDDEEDYEKDEYEVEAEVIEIRDDEEEDERDSDEEDEKSEK
ncbi:MAG: DUF4342 domain-containing protein [Balneolaceae bacterium]|nr:DUF4342 domain-containing protein [Balneolaceae bacterium]